jgi:hypothetical protein
MQKISSTLELKEAIRQLESQKVDQLKLLKEQFNLTRENFIHVNVIKNAFGEAVTSPLLINNVIGAVIGISAGYFSKKLFVGSSANQLRRLIGNMIQLGITTFAAKKPEFIQSIGKQIFHRIARNRKPAS